jgi:hypothetical protein
MKADGRGDLTALGHEQIVVGYEEAAQTADALAVQLRLEARAET